MTGPDPKDDRTIAVYDARAEEYAALTGSETPDAHLQAFIDAMPPGGSVLDLGCGPGAASAMMRNAGLRPDPVDASGGMIRVAREVHGLPARIATFDDITSVALYDGVWANFSLLHAPRDALPRHLAALATALRPGGLLHIGMKTGAGAKRDGIDRLYTYVTEPELTGLLDAAGFDVIYRGTGEDMGLDGVMAPWVILRGVRRA